MLAVEHGLQSFIDPVRIRLFRPVPVHDFNFCCHVCSLRLKRSASRRYLVAARPASSSRGFAHTSPPLRIADQRVNRSASFSGSRGGTVIASMHRPPNLIAASMWENITRHAVRIFTVYIDAKIPAAVAALISSQCAFGFPIRTLQRLSRQLRAESL